MEFSKNCFTRSNIPGYDAKTLSREEFFDKYHLKESDSALYDALATAKMGHIKVVQTRGNKVGFSFEGETATFNEGISLFVDTEIEYYYTSVINTINWEEGYFDTLNSRYNFEFEEQSYE